MLIGFVIYIQNQKKHKGGFIPMKKITGLMAVALIIASMSSTAFGASSVNTASLKAQASAAYTNCVVNGCNLTGAHQHDGKTYAGHTVNDGHTYHEFCGVSNCTTTGTHDHNGSTYFSHHNGDGHNYHTNSQQHNKADGHGTHRKSGGHH